MVGELITLPLRVGVRATQLWLRAAEQTVAVVAETTGRLVGGVTRDRTPAWTEPRYEPVEQPLAPPTPEPSPRASTPYEPAPELVETPEPTHVSEEPTHVSEEPTHVSEEPELVEEVAEPGAENGAGASVHVEPPWEGYDRMTAADITDRLTGVSAAELAAVQLYETSTKGRKTVLEAVEHELQIWAGSGSHS